MKDVKVKKVFFKSDLWTDLPFRGEVSITTQ